MFCLVLIIQDEIDTGISGKTSFVVGKKLKNIGKEHQVICITHQAQVAIFGDNNKLINKKSNDDFVEIEILDLDKIGKIKEVARMLGGINITDTVLKNAEELVISAE
jgi:DNA repair protein RecN (Recombination protein N)